MIEAVFTGIARTNYVHIPGPAGDAAPLLLVHGVTRRWQTYLPLASSLAIRRPIYAMDWRGHGKSSPTPDQYRVVDYVVDAVEMATQCIGKPVVLYGHSLGAMVVAAAAAELGEQVAAVIMEDPPLQTMGERIGETMLLDLFKAMHHAAKSTDAIPDLARQLAETRLTDPGTLRETRLGDVRDAGSLRFAASCLKQLDPGVLEPVVAGRWLDGYDTTTIFQRLQVPSLLLQADPACGGMLIDDDAQQLEDLAADLTRVRLAGCTHNIHWDRTTELLNYVHTFLETIDC